MKILKEIGQRVRVKIDRVIGGYLRSHYSSFRVVRPYIIQLHHDGLLRGKIAVVTGGSGAIGRACCFRLASEGAKVYVCGTQLERAVKISDEIVQMGLEAEGIVLNLRNVDNIKKVFSDIYQKEGHIDILVNSAGGSARERANNLVMQDIDVIDEILSINLRGTMLCCQEAIRYMIKNEYGRIVNITSVIGVQGKAGFSEYAASKGGMIAFIKSLAQEVGRYGITVNGVAPGIVQRGEISQEMIENISHTNYMQNYGKPEDISAAVSFFCQEDASFITGQNLAVDGGRSLGLKEW